MASLEPSHRLTKAEMEKTAARLIGQELATVIYYELKTDGCPEPSWNADPTFDSLDFGLDLRMADGQVFGICWDWDFCQYGLSLRPCSVLESVTGPAAWDVTAISRWRPFVRRKVRDVNIDWVNWDEVGISAPCPQQITVGCGDGCRARVRSADHARELYGGADHVVVLFGDPDGGTHGPLA